MRRGVVLRTWAGAAFMSALSAAGYTGPVSIEHEDDRLHGAEALRMNADAPRRAFAIARRAPDRPGQAEGSA